MVEAYGIFEGGGAKGLAHVGALKAAEKAQIRFIGLAGSSAGSIVASLVAAGYKADQLFDPDDENGGKILDEDLVKLFGKWRWRFFRFLRWFAGNFDYPVLRPVASVVLLALILGTAGYLVFTYALGLYQLPWYFWGPTILAASAVFVLFNTYIPFGFLSTGDFEYWLNEQLQRKLFPREPERVVCFGDIKHTDLRIISTDIITRKPIVFNRESHPKYSVAKAVRSSIAIPGVFAPLAENIDDQPYLLVDGGVLSNFPAWVFDKDRKKRDGITFTIGFKLQNRSEETDPKQPRRSFLRYVNDLGKVFFGDNPLQARAIEDLHLVPITVSSKTLDFHMPREEKVRLYKEGFDAARPYFRSRFTGPIRKREVTEYLKSLKDEFVKAIGHDMDLRLNVAIPVAPDWDELRVLYPFAMEKHADDRLKLPVNVGVMGRCYTTGGAILVDMANAERDFKKVWLMNKYQQALVMKDMKSLLCVPLRIQVSFVPDGTPDIVGVLSIDSKDDFLPYILRADSLKDALAMSIQTTGEMISCIIRDELMPESDSNDPSPGNNMVSWAWDEVSDGVFAAKRRAILDARDQEYVRNERKMVERRFEEVDENNILIYLPEHIAKTKDQAHAVDRGELMITSPDAPDLIESMDLIEAEIDPEQAE